MLTDKKKHQIIASVLHANCFVILSDEIGPPYWEKEIKMIAKRYVEAVEKKYKLLASVLFQIEGGDMYQKAQSDCEELVALVSKLDWHKHHKVIEYIKTLEEDEQDSEN
jgi:hypothetical protein